MSCSFCKAQRTAPSGPGLTKESGFSMNQHCDGGSLVTQGKRLILALRPTMFVTLALAGFVWLSPRAPAQTNFIITTASLPNGTAGSSYSANVAATGGSQPYAFSATGLPSALNISSAGAITGTPASAGTYSVVVTATDSSKVQRSTNKQFYLTVDPATLAITTTSLQNGIVGQSYSQTVTASGGITPYSFSAKGLPPNLTMSTSGVISGTPTTAGTSTVTVTVTGSFIGNTTYASFAPPQATKQFSLTIDPAIQPLSITTRTLAVGGTGQMYSQAVIATGGTPPYTFSASGLPPGLSISAGGNISGTPSANGSYPVMITVVDSAKGQASRNYALTITSSLTVTTLSLPTGSVGHSYFQDLTAVGALHHSLYVYRDKQVFRRTSP